MYSLHKLNVYFTFLYHCRNELHTYTNTNVTWIAQMRGKRQLFVQLWCANYCSILAYYDATCFTQVFSLFSYLIFTFTNI